MAAASLTSGENTLAKYTGTKVYKMRMLETYLSGLSGKNMEQRRTRLSQHGHRLGRRKLSNFGVQRREKQKLQCNHGLREK